MHMMYNAICALNQSELVAELILILKFGFHHIYSSYQINGLFYSKYHNTHWQESLISEREIEDSIFIRK